MVCTMQKEIPVLHSLYDKYNREGVEFISISFDSDIDIWIDELNRNIRPWKQFIIQFKESKNYRKDFDAFSLPTTIVYDKNLIKIKQFYGYDSDIENKLDSLITNKIK